MFLRFFHLGNLEQLGLHFWAIDIDLRFANYYRMVIVVEYEYKIGKGFNMTILFKTTKQLELQIDEYLDAVSQGALVFRQGVKNYLDNDEIQFAERLTTISKLENKADDLRRMVENQLYTHSLIPEHRGDVLGLLESMDEVINTSKKTLSQFSIEEPNIPINLNKEFLELTEMSVLAADSIVFATRAFFRDISSVKDHIHKVMFYEKEADKVEDRLNREIFGMDVDLSRKLHISSFVSHIGMVSDMAESVGDRLAIYTIKRTV